MTKKSLPSLLFAAAFAASPAVWAAGGVNAHEPYVRAVPAGQDQTAAYMTLRNSGKKDVALVKAASAAARTVELHTVVDEGGMKKMRPVERIVVKAGGETRLQPGGLHIMLIGLAQPLQEGANVALTLSFDDGSKLDVKAPVRAIVQGGGMSHPGHAH
jgi:copper(I)-binding protein